MFGLNRAFSLESMTPISGSGPNQLYCCGFININKYKSKHIINIWQIEMKQAILSYWALGKADVVDCRSARLVQGPIM